MLDAISDFWKPAKKTQAQEKLRPEQLQIGSSIGFGFVPQASLSGRRLQVSAINTYQFGDEALTSFVLTQDKDPGVSMIVAESDGEQYLAISRRIAIGDRMKMFDSRDLENVIDKPDVTSLPCKDAAPDFKGWIVASYKRELQGMTGRIFKGDFRKTTLPDNKEAQEFKYTLLVSESNEHAIEIEKYDDGRVEIYATVYRRMSDIGEVSHPTRTAEGGRPDLKLASSTEEKPAVAAAAPAPTLEPAKPDPTRLESVFGMKPESAKPEPVKAPPAPAAIMAEPVKAEPIKSESVKSEPVKTEPVKLQEFSKPAAPAFSEAKPPVTEATKPEQATKPANQTTANQKEEVKPMESAESARNGAYNGASNDKSKMSASVQSSAPSSYKQEVKAVSKTMNGMDNEAIECDLRVANKIIDEAIRNEMRLSDIVRRIIELPVAYPEAVQIPITLSDDDYSLLAIRYGISASDRNAIKNRIIEDLNGFSGANKKAA